MRSIKADKYENQGLVLICYSNKIKRTLISSHEKPKYSMRVELFISSKTRKSIMRLGYKLELKSHNVSYKLNDIALTMLYSSNITAELQSLG